MFICVFLCSPSVGYVKYIYIDILYDHALVIQVSRDLATMCSHIVFYARSLFGALDCLHNKYHVVHGDIKPSNTKFYRDASSSSFVFKLLDFGMSRCVEPRQRSAVRCDTGTTSFSPPECAARFGAFIQVFFLHNYTNYICHTLQTHILTLVYNMSAQDIYSAGISILALMTGHEAIFNGETREPLLYEMTAMYGSAALSNLGMICVSLYSTF